MKTLMTHFLATLNEQDARFKGNHLFLFEPNADRFVIYENDGSTLVNEDIDYIPVMQTRAEPILYLTINKRIDWDVEYYIAIKIKGDAYDVDDDPDYQRIETACAGLNRTFGEPVVTYEGKRYVFKASPPKRIGYFMRGADSFAMLSCSMMATEIENGWYAQDVSIKLDNVELDIVRYTRNMTRRYYTGDEKDTQDNDFNIATGRAMTFSMDVVITDAEMALLKIPRGKASLKACHKLTETFDGDTIEYDVMIRSSETLAQLNHGCRVVLHMVETKPAHEVVLLDLDEPLQGMMTYGEVFDNEVIADGRTYGVPFMGSDSYFKDIIRNGDILSLTHNYSFWGFGIGGAIYAEPAPVTPYADIGDLRPLNRMWTRFEYRHLPMHMYDLSEIHEINKGFPILIRPREPSTADMQAFVFMVIGTYVPSKIAFWEYTLEEIEEYVAKLFPSITGTRNILRQFMEILNNQAGGVAVLIMEGTVQVDIEVPISLESIYDLTIDGMGTFVTDGVVQSVPGFPYGQYYNNVWIESDYVKLARKHIYAGTATHARVIWSVHKYEWESGVDPAPSEKDIYHEYDINMPASDVVALTLRGIGTFIDNLDVEEVSGYAFTKEYTKDLEWVASTSGTVDIVFAPSPPGDMEDYKPDDISPCRTIEEALALVESTYPANTFSYGHRIEVSNMRWICSSGTCVEMSCPTTHFYFEVANKNPVDVFLDDNKLYVRKTLLTNSEYDKVTANQLAMMQDMDFTDVPGRLVPGHLKHIPSNPAEFGVISNIELAPSGHLLKDGAVQSGSPFTYGIPDEDIIYTGSGIAIKESVVDAEVTQVRMTSGIETKRYLSSQVGEPDEQGYHLFYVGLLDETVKQDDILRIETIGGSLPATFLKDGEGVHDDWGTGKTMFFSPFPSRGTLRIHDDYIPYFDEVIIHRKTVDYIWDDFAQVPKDKGYYLFEHDENIALSYIHTFDVTGIGQMISDFTTQTVGGRTIEIPTTDVFEFNKCIYVKQEHIHSGAIETVYVEKRDFTREVVGIRASNRDVDGAEHISDYETDISKAWQSVSLIQSARKETPSLTELDLPLFRLPGHEIMGTNRLRLEIRNWIMTQLPVGGQAPLPQASVPEAYNAFDNALLDWLETKRAEYIADPGLTNEIALPFGLTLRSLFKDASTTFPADYEPESGTLENITSWAIANNALRLLAHTNGKFKMDNDAYTESEEQIYSYSIVRSDGTMQFCAPGCVDATNARWNAVSVLDERGATPFSMHIEGETGEHMYLKAIGNMSLTRRVSPNIAPTKEQLDAWLKAFALHLFVGGGGE